MSDPTVPTETTTTAEQPSGHDPLVLIEHELKGEFQVLKSAFHRLYEQEGFKITRVLGQSDDETDAPLMPETSTAHIQAAAPSDAPALAEPVGIAPAPAEPVEAQAAETGSEPVAAEDGEHAGAV